MTPRAYALLALLATALALGGAAQAQDAPQKPRCTFQTLPDGRLQITCPRGVQGPGKGRVPG